MTNSVHNPKILLHFFLLLVIKKYFLLVFIRAYFLPENMPK